MPIDSLIAVFVFSFVVGFGAVVSPGPVSTAIVSQSPRQGWTVGPLIATGHSLMEAIIVFLIALGLSRGLAHPIIQVIIGILGGALLISMGLGMLNSVRRGKARVTGVNQDADDMSRIQMIRLGILTTLSNPFWYAWWVTVAAGYLAQARALGGASVVAFYFGHISADYAWDTTLSAVISSGKRWITDKVYAGIITICGLFFLYLGFVFILQGVQLI